jgi:hypothetical protein
MSDLTSSARSTIDLGIPYKRAHFVACEFRERPFATLHGTKILSILHLGKQATATPIEIMDLDPARTLVSIASSCG